MSSCPNCISIPHGTIKRAEKHVCLQPDDISIPHGTIKRHRGEGARLGQSQFQFHMVRLKDALRSSFRRISSISIPHGTIKSFAVNGKYTGQNVFQFHMVRLKVSLVKN